MNKIAKELLRIAKEILATNPLEVRYGGLPSNGGFNSHTEYEVGASSIAESIHCILGSLYKIIARGEQESGSRAAEKGHIYEEFGIVEFSINEYQRPIYLKQLSVEDRYSQATAKSMTAASLSLTSLAAQLKNALRGSRNSVPEDIYDVADACYDVIGKLSDAIFKSFIDYPIMTQNAFADKKLRSSVRKLEQAIKNMDFSR